MDLTPATDFVPYTEMMISLFMVLILFGGILIKRLARPKKVRKYSIDTIQPARFSKVE